jgi:hypothetical protein
MPPSPLTVFAALIFFYETGAYFICSLTALRVASSFKVYLMYYHALHLLALAGLAAAAPQRNRGNRQTARQQATAQVDEGISQATDGSTILDTTATIKSVAPTHQLIQQSSLTSNSGLPIRYRVSGPAASFLPASGVEGATTPAADAPAPSMGLNVLLHGDGGTSFFDFPNQAVQNDLMGVAVLSPDPNLRWGGGQGLQRTDGVAHSQAVADLVTNELPQMMSFNSSNVWYTGVSGGALTLSGYFIPAQMRNFQGTGVELNCGALEPQVEFQDAAAVMGSTRIHYVSAEHSFAQLHRE